MLRSDRPFCSFIRVPAAVMKGSVGMKDMVGGGIYWSYLSSVPSFPFFLLLLLMIMMMMADSFLREVHPIGPFHVILVGLSVTGPAPLTTGAYG